MSTFLYLERYAAEPESSRLPILKRDLETVVAKLPKYKLIDEDGIVGITLPGTMTEAVIEDAGLSCQLHPATDTDLLIDRLREVSALIPGSVITDEEGETY